MPQQALQQAHFPAVVRDEVGEELPQWWDEPLIASAAWVEENGSGRSQADQGNWWDEARVSSAPHQEDMFDEEDERNFEKRWSTMFSRGSPLVEGTAEDPFKEDLKSRRTKVVWKKNSERAGHHRRYQDRRQKKPGDENGLNPDADEDFIIAFDAMRPATGSPAAGWSPDPNRSRVPELEL